MKAHETKRIRHPHRPRSNHSNGSGSSSSSNNSSNSRSITSLSSDCTSEQQHHDDEFEEDDEEDVRADGDRLPLIDEHHPAPSQHALPQPAVRDPCSCTAWQKRVSVLIAVVVALGLWIDDWTPQRTDSVNSETSKGAVNRTAPAHASTAVPRMESTVSPSLSPLRPQLQDDDVDRTSFLNLQSLPRLQCPDVPPRPVSATDARHHTEWYEKESSKLITTDVYEYLKVFRETEFDNWGHTYEQVKRGMFSWKSQHFAELLLQEDEDRQSTVKTLYESACGIGLNLFMTLEILSEASRSSSSTSLDHIAVYGNEYQADSTSLARSIASQAVFPGRLGGICQADSTNLSHVPSDAFDVVYTGYITPLADPLLLSETLQLKSDDDLYGRYTEYCESDNATSKTLRLRAQHLQEVWYAQWVGEMIRIAKPGAKIIVEQVSYPLCEAYYDWGGVSQHSWVRALEAYRWPVDPKSLVYQDDTIFRHRYHLAMRKLPR